MLPSFLLTLPNALGAWAGCSRSPPSSPPPEDAAPPIASNDGRLDAAAPPAARSDSVLDAALRGDAGRLPTTDELDKIEAECRSIEGRPWSVVLAVKPPRATNQAAVFALAQRLLSAPNTICFGGGHVSLSMTTDEIRKYFGERAKLRCTPWIGNTWEPGKCNPSCTGELTPESFVPAVLRQHVQRVYLEDDPKFDMAHEPVKGSSKP